MAVVGPFRGIYFDVARVDLAQAAAPPYDVISPAEQDALYALSPHNIIRLILNRAEPGDTENARYDRAGAWLRSALDEQILRRDSEPALYEYVQHFTDPATPGTVRERRTLLCAMELQPYSAGVVLPHEETHSKAKADRLMLMTATQANPEPIYGLYEDADGEIAAALDGASRSAAPLLHLGAPGDAATCGEHTVWRHSGESLCQEITALFGPRRVWIADGHHRYETALAYEQQQLAAGRAAGGSCSRILIGLTAFEDPGIVVLPTHRMLLRGAMPAGQTPGLLQQLGQWFTITPDADPETFLAGHGGQGRFVMLVGAGTPRSYGLALRNRSAVDTLAEAGHCEAWRRLDVTVLQTLVLDHSLGIRWKDLASTPEVAYTRDAAQAAAWVAAGEWQLAFLLPQPSVDEVRDVAAAGDKMPQKSTFFYPKLWSGLILRSLL